LKQKKHGDQTPDVRVSCVKREKKKKPKSQEDATGSARNRERGKLRGVRKKHRRLWKKKEKKENVKNAKKRTANDPKQERNSQK